MFCLFSWVELIFVQEIIEMISNLKLLKLYFLTKSENETKK